MRRDEADEQHPRPIVAGALAQPRDRRVADCLVIRIVFRIAGADRVEPGDIARTGNWIAHRAPHLSDPVPEMHRPMLDVETGRVIGVAVVQFSDGLDADSMALQFGAPARNAAVVAHRVVPMADGVHVASGRKAGARRHAKGRGRVGVGEADAACGEPVEMRCAHDRVTGARERARLMRIRDDEDEMLCLHLIAP